MPKSKIFLPDVNVWLALATQRHAHARICSTWLESLGSEEVALCRVTQMGLLRLLTNQSAMGEDVLSSRNAWKTYIAISMDERIRFSEEPFGLEKEWQKLLDHNRPSTKLWTDAYLIAFARTAGM
jgi:toxin-antitoxin system PIN domain toxin